MRSHNGFGRKCKLIVSNKIALMLKDREFDNLVRYQQGYLRQRAPFW
jgi:hypothetical protein